MKITQFISEHDSDTRRNNWTAEVIADGRTWMVKGVTSLLGTHTIGQIKPKDNPAGGLHYASQLAKLIREFVYDNINIHLQTRVIGTVYGPAEPEQPVIGLETRAVLAAIIEELGDGFFDRELDAADDTEDRTALDKTVAYAKASGFADAQEMVMNKLRELTASRDRVDVIIAERQRKEQDTKFVEFDLVLNNLGGKPFNLKESK